MSATLVHLSGSALPNEYAAIVAEIHKCVMRLEKLVEQKAQIELHAAIAGVALDARTQSAQGGEVRP